MLIYLKAILQAFSHSVNGSSILVERLRENLSTIWDDECKARSLVRWACIVGAAVAKGELKGWFVEKFGRMDLHWGWRGGFRLSMFARIEGCIWREHD